MNPETQNTPADEGNSPQETSFPLESGVADNADHPVGDSIGGGSPEDPPDMDTASDLREDDGEAPETKASEQAPSGDGTDSGVVDSEVGDATDDGTDTADNAESASPTAFKDSGSFFRERVARALAEQGYDFKESGTWAANAEEDSGAAHSETESEAPSLAAESPDFDRDSEAVGADDADPERVGGDAESSAVSEPVVSASADDPPGTSSPTEVGQERQTREFPYADTSETSEPDTADHESAPRDGDVSEETIRTAAFPALSDELDPDSNDITAEFQRDESAKEPPEATSSPPDTESGGTERGESEAQWSPGHVPSPPTDVSNETLVGPDAHDERPSADVAHESSATAAPDTETSESSDTPDRLTTSAAEDHDASAGDVPSGLGGLSSDAEDEDAAGPPPGVRGDSDPEDVGRSDSGPQESARGGLDHGPTTPSEGVPSAMAAGAGGEAPPAVGGDNGGQGGPGGPGDSGGPGGPDDPDGPDDEKAVARAAGIKGKLGRKGKAKGGKSSKPQRPLWWRITRGGLIAAGVFIVLGITGFGVAYATIPVPDAAKDDATDQGSTFYYSDGETEFAERGVNREQIDVSVVPEHVQDAVTSAEDRGFWTEPGVSVSGTVRAAWSTLTGKQLQGGSTITQQMVRNYYEGVSMEQTVTRKLQEIIISLKVDRSKSKEWVMEQYLNTIYFGRNAYGIQAAAEAYYHKDVEELEPAEAAFLAAAIQQPTKFGEADNNTTGEMQSRWEAVVNGMVKTGALTESEAAELEFPEPDEETPQTDLSGYKGYMLQQTMSELEDLGYSEDNINRGGYKIVTTFDEDLMDKAKEAVEDTIDPDTLPEGVVPGLTAIDPATGEVVAFYGGKDYNENQYDSAFRGSAQAGSAMKPYVLAAALRNGHSLHSVVDGRGPQTIQGSSIQNAGNAPGGPMNLIQATQKSNNIGYIKLAMEVGLEEVVQTSYDIGLREDSIGDDQVVPTLALGINDVRPVDQASGFATFANGGEHVEAHVVREILDEKGDNQRAEVETSTPLSEGEAADVTYALQQVVTSGTGTQARLPDGRPAAGKTGTTDSSVASWFVGFTPQLSSAVGVYNSNNAPFSVPGWGQLSGGTLTATIWRNFMAAAMEGEEVEQFPSPSYGGTTENWAPNIPTREPEEPDNEPQEEPEPEEPEPEEPEPEEPDIPEIPEEPPDEGPPDDPGTDPGWPPGDPPAESTRE